MGVVSDMCCEQKHDFRELFPLLSPCRSTSLTLDTCLFTSTIVLARTIDDNGPYGLGKLSIVCRYLISAID